MAKEICEAYLFYSVWHSVWMCLARKNDDRKWACGASPYKDDAIDRVRSLVNSKGYEWPRHVRIDTEVPLEYIRQFNSDYANFLRRNDPNLKHRKMDDPPEGSIII